MEWNEVGPTIKPTCVPNNTIYVCFDIICFTLNQCFNFDSCLASQSTTDEARQLHINIYVFSIFSSDHDPFNLSLPYLVKI